MNKTQIKKTTQAGAYLLSKANGKMPYLKLLKLLYLADRESLLESEHAMTGDHYVSMKNGPVLSETYDFIKGQSNQSEYWQFHIQTNGYTTILVNDPGINELSPYDLGILDNVFSHYGNMNRWDIVELTHEFPEWVNPGPTSKEIPLSKILQALGYQNKNLERVLKNLEYQTKVDQILG